MPKCRNTTFSVAAAAMLNCRKMLFWSRDLCLHAILLSNVHTHRLKWRQDITEKRFSICRPSAILNLQNFDEYPRDVNIRIRIPNLIGIG